jgi:hypothetical protein
VDRKNIFTTPVDHPLNAKPYAPGPRESQRQAEDQDAEDSVFVFDIEDTALVGYPDDGRKRAHEEM